MSNIQEAANAQIKELSVNANTVATEKGGQVWSKVSDEEYVHVLAEPVQASFTKKENKEQTPYTGLATAVKFVKTSEKGGSTKWNQLVVGQFQKVGSEEIAEFAVRRTRVTSEDKNFKRIPTKALEEAIN